MYTLICKYTTLIQSRKTVNDQNDGGASHSCRLSSLSLTEPSTCVHWRYSPSFPLSLYNIGWTYEVGYFQLSETADLGWETLYKYLAFENHQITQIYPIFFFAWWGAWGRGPAGPPLSAALVVMTCVWNFEQNTRFLAQIRFIDSSIYSVQTPTQHDMQIARLSLTRASTYKRNSNS